MGKIIGGVIGGLVGGPWGAAIGVGLGHMVDVNADTRVGRTIQGDAHGRIVEINIRTGRFSEIDPNVEVIWAHVGFELDSPGSLVMAMVVTEDGRPVIGLSPQYQDNDGNVLVIVDRPTSAYGNRLDFDLILPVSAMDVPPDASIFQVTVLAANSRILLDSRTVEITLNTPGVSQPPRDFQHVLNVLWGAVVADGQVDRLEVRQVKQFLEREIGLSRSELQAVKEYLHKLQLTRQQALDSARVIARQYERTMRNRLLDMVVEIVAADNRVTQEEDAYVMEVGRVFGLSENELDRIFEAHKQAGRLRALMVLGLGADATRDEISKRFKELALKYHPDRLVGLDEEFQRLGAAKFTRIKQAYDTLMSE